MDNLLQLRILRIDEGFKTLLAPLTEKEFEQLEENIKKEGCREPLALWKGIIVDGHNRYRICHKHKIPFRTVDMKFSCREEAVAWICSNQLGRRNISEETKKYLIGKKYESEKIMGVRNANGNNQHTIIEPPKIPILSQNKTAHEMGKQYSISHNTVYKYGIYSKALDVIQSKCPEIAHRILMGNIKASHENIINLSRLSKKELYKLFNDMCKEKNGQVSYSDIRHELQWKATRKSNVKQPVLAQEELAIKQLPKFDPDAEFSSLSLTIPSWIETIDRTKRNTQIESTSEEARKIMTAKLANLLQAARELFTVISEVK